MKQRKIRETVNPNNSKLITYQDGCERYNLGICTVMKLARESGALRKIGRSARIDTTIMDAYIDSFIG